MNLVETSDPVEVAQLMKLKNFNTTTRSGEMSLESHELKYVMEEIRSDGESLRFQHHILIPSMAKGRWQNIRRDRRGSGKAG